MVASRTSWRADTSASLRWLTIAAVGAIGAGILLRILAVLRMDLWQDGLEYVEMGFSWSRGDGFLLPDSERFGRRVLFGPGYSHHFPPAYPFTLGLIFSIFGFGVVQAKAATLALSLAALGTVYATTRNLFGAGRAAVVTGILALDPSLVWVTGVGFSENFTLLFSTLTLWALLRSLPDIRFVLPAGVFWTSAYLARSSAGLFGVVPALAGLWWWSRFRGWRTLFSPWCIGAGAVFLLGALLWGWRNYSLFGDWGTSEYVGQAYDYAYANPSLWAQGLAGKGAYFLLLGVAYALPFLPELRASFQRVREAETSLLWLFVLVIWGLAWLVTASFWPYEPRPQFDPTHHRYILIGLVPLLWIVVKNATDLGALLPRWAVLASVLLVLSGLVLLNPIRQSSARAAQFIDPYMRDGDSVIILGSIYKYDLDVYFSRIERITVQSVPGRDPPEFAFLGDMAPEPLPDGYVLVGSFEQGGTSPSVTHVIARRRIVEERGLPTDVRRSYR